MQIDSCRPDALRTSATSRCAPALKQHEQRASLVLDLEEKVAAVVKKLKECGLVSPYLRSFVMARINTLGWIKGEPPPFEDVLKTIRERVAKFNVEKIKPQDLASPRARLTK
jgi:ParB family transcriptional regulator, chromosome partitioning protein